MDYVYDGEGQRRASQILYNHLMAESRKMINQYAANLLEEMWRLPSPEPPPFNPAIKEPHAPPRFRVFGL